ncbi:MAG: DoxX family membrane protein [Deltaproteobacteria bacterium]|nr:DoxX family membrane protein [Deltaproteobacteria bacterium]
MVEGQTGFLRGQWKQEGLFAIIARLTLGAVFIYASIDKIIHPAAFAKAIYNYQILPDSFINLTAIVLPWLELILGLFLIIALFREGSACIVTVLMLVFFGAMIFNLARGLDIHCGCFGTSTDGTNNAPMVWYVMRDGLFLIPALYFFYQTFRGKEQTVRLKRGE